MSGKNKQQTVTDLKDLGKVALKPEAAEPEVVTPTVEPKAEIKPEATTPPAEVKPEGKVSLEAILKHLPESVQAKIKKLPQEDQLDIAKDFLKMAYPKGLAEPYRLKLQAEVLPQVKQIASEYGVDLTSLRVAFSFPTDGDPLVSIFDPTQVEDKKGGKKKGFKNREWGECSVTNTEGKVIAYETPSAMAKALGLRITGHSDQLDTFKKPAKAEGLEWEKRWTGKTITVVSGDLDMPSKGIHVKLS